MQSTMSRQKAQPRCTTTVQFSPEVAEYIRGQSDSCGLSLGAYLETLVQKSRLGFKDELEQLMSKNARLKSEKAELIDAQMLSEEQKIEAIKAEAENIIRAQKLSEKRKIEAIKLETRAAIEAVTQSALAAESALSKSTVSELAQISKRYDFQLSELSEKEKAAQERYDQSFEKLIFECNLDCNLSPAELVLRGIVWLVGPDSRVYSSYLALGELIRTTLNDKKFSSREQAVQYLLSLDRRELTEAELQYLKRVDRANNQIYKSLEQVDAVFGTDYSRTISENYALPAKR